MKRKTKKETVNDAVVSGRLTVVIGGRRLNMDIVSEKWRDTKILVEDAMRVSLKHPKTNA